MYEDPAIEQRLFPPGGRIFCIASAGCTALQLSTSHEVVAVDINPAQVEYVAQRIAGAAPRPGWVDRGMSLLRACAPSVGWSARKLGSFLDLEDPAEQLRYWRRHLDTARLRMALDLVLAPGVMQLVYARHFLRVLPPHFGQVIRARLTRAFGRHPNRGNPHVRALLTGEWTPAPSPPEARRIRLEHADAVAFLEREPPHRYDGLTLSNILDGASEAEGSRLWAAVGRVSKPGAVAILRSFAEPRDPASAELATEDRSMIWGSVEVRRS